MWNSSQILSKVLWFEPSNLFVGGPQLACLVDINFASLLSIRFAEFFVDAESVEACFEDATFATEIGSTGKAKSSGKAHFCRVDLVPVWVVAKIQHLAFPVRFQALSVPVKGLYGRTVVRQRSVISIIAIGPNNTSRLGCC